MAGMFESPARPVDYQNQPSKTQGGRDVQLTPEEEEIQKEMYEKYIKAKKYKANFDKDWEKWYRLYSGQHWDGQRPDWKSTPVVNFIWSTIETIIPIMTDSSPQWVVAPTKPENAQTADVMNDIVRRVWIKNDMDLKLPIILRNTMKYGTGFAKVWWKESDDAGEDGDVAVSIVDPRHLFPSPGALDLKDAAYLCYAANVPINYVEDMYPDATGRLVGGIWEEDLTVSKTITSQSGGTSGTVIGPVQSSRNLSDGTGSSASTSNPVDSSGGRPIVDRSSLVTLIECWHRKDGRAWLTVCANGIVLRHGESPFDHNMFPFVKFVDYSIPSCFWGMGEVQQLEKLQDFINRRRGQTQDILRITANPPLVADANSGINPKAMTTRPGTIIYKNPQTEVKWLVPPQLPAALFEIQALDKQDFDSVSGIYDVTQGRKPKGIEAASAINELQEAAQTRLRLKVREMEGSLRNLGELVIALVQQFYTEERVIRITGGDMSKPQFVTINQETVDSQGNAVRINDVSVGKYDIEIGVGSTLPVNKARLYKEMLELFQMGAVDAQAVLENSSLSAAAQAKIIQRMNAQMAAQQGMAQPGAEGNTGSDPNAMQAELDSIVSE